MGTPFQITIDCQDAHVMCAFWSTALGYVEEPPPAGYLSWEDFLRSNGVPVPPAGSIGAIVDPDKVGPRILFLRVPEKKTVKNRVHLDVRAGRTDDARMTKITELREAGATEIRRVDENGEWWMVMADPEGNEFCVA
ncbi:MAG: VOC family protein [Ilumatobacter sp.]|uniref:VOC family protein n=1 Tax=Ilumatobacter sp. TaxID=1967498 RepID=UPI00262DF6B7|nr:VOC family protein [Ilumatobacter sp.]MDJ0767680.1 VOC family protein [Ilumatobacter sp.]